ncbi:MAG: cell division protein FtsA [Candidatus Omnitrophica bacterium]|nr:cell division protein FtsA [Candidatus Omnitrophota bacterium]
MRKEIVCGLDIGTSKISAVLGEFRDDNLVILAKDRMASEGMERGKVLNMEKFTAVIESIMHKVNKDFLPNRIILGISNDCLRVMNYRRSIMLSEKTQEIKNHHIERLINETVDNSVPFDHEVLHIFTREFMVDGQSKIRDPRGMFGSKLSADFLFITLPTSVLQNIKKGIYNAGYDVDITIYSGLASAFAFLEEEERNSGVLYLEIGGGITTVVKFMGGVPINLEIFPFGGIDIDKAIAKALNISLDEAEELKKNYGSLYPAIKQEKIIRKNGEKELSIEKLIKIIENVSEGFLFQIKRKIEKSSVFDYLPAGIVLGGCTFLLEGLVEKVGEIFRFPIRLGTVRVSEDLSGKEDSLYSWADTIGLLYFDHFNRASKKDSKKTLNPIKKFILHAKKIFEEYF